VRDESIVCSLKSECYGTMSGRFYISHLQIDQFKVHYDENGKIGLIE
jgi:hypothetical protein